MPEDQEGSNSMSNTEQPKGGNVVSGNEGNTKDAFGVEDTQPIKIKSTRELPPVEKTERKKTMSPEEAYKRLRLLEELKETDVKQTESSNSGGDKTTKKQSGRDEESFTEKGSEKSTGEQPEREPVVNKEKKGFWGMVSSALDKASNWIDEHPKEAIIATGIADEVLENIIKQRKERRQERRAEKEAKRKERADEKAKAKYEEEKGKSDKHAQKPQEEAGPGFPKEKEKVQKNGTRDDEVGGTNRQKEDMDKQPQQPPRTEKESPTSLDEKKEKTEDYSELDYASLRNKLKNEKDGLKRDKLREEKFRRAQMVQENGFYDLSQESLEKQIIDTLTANDQDTFDNSLVQIATNAESYAVSNIPNGENIRYGDDKRLKNSVYDIVRGEIDAVRLDVYLGMSDEELKARGLSRAKLEKDRQELEETRLGLTSIRQPQGYLQAEPSEELLDEYASKNIPGAEARLRRLQKEKQAREDLERERKEAEDRKRHEQNLTATPGVENEATKAWKMFLSYERWSNEMYKFEGEKDPIFSSLINAGKDNEAMLFDKRVLLHQAAAMKRGVTEKGKVGEYPGALNLELMAYNEKMKQITAEDVMNFYNTPGVRQALEIYVDMLDKDEKIDIEGKKICLRECRSRFQLDAFRMHIVEKMFGDENFKANMSNKKISREEAELAAFEAEQVAFNLAYVTNLFEASDSQWEGFNKKTGKWERIDADFVRSEYSGLHRIRGFKIFKGLTDMMFKGLRTTFRPMDALIEQSLKAEERTTETGVFTEWATKQIQNSLNEAGYAKEVYKKGDFDEIEIINDNEKDMYWKVEKNGDKYKLYAPECYPIMQLGSWWEDGQSLDQGKAHNLLWFLREKKEIDWVNSSAKHLAGYSVDALDNAAVWGLFQEKARENSLDESELRKLLGEIGRRNDDRFIRWIHYAASGLYSEITYPKKRITAEKRRNIELIRKNYLKRKDFETADRYLPEKLYFSWDEKASSGEKFETWWRETTGLN